MGINMKAVILYVSQTGFTKKYAEWLAEELNCNAVSYEKRNEVRLDEYDTVLFGSWCCAGGIKKLAWFKKLLPQLNAKKIVVFAVGAMPMDSPQVDNLWKQNFSDKEKAQFSTYYLQGGLCYEKMGFASKMMMKMFASMMAKKKDKTPEEQETAKVLGTSCDHSKREYINAIVEECLGRE